MALSELLAEHDGCTWEEVSPCVYCKEHGVRLYQGQLPPDRDPELAAKRAACDHSGPVEEYEDGTPVGLGFYFICANCGEQWWPDE